MTEPDKWIPKVGLRFKTPDDAWQFWLAYGGRAGFDVRKRNTNLSKIDGKATSCKYVCSNEGVRRKGQTDHVPKLYRAETRTNCDAHIIVSLDRLTGNYEVIKLSWNTITYFICRKPDT
jgi:zinc finger SWIM domain-containing protein 3